MKAYPWDISTEKGCEILYVREWEKTKSEVDERQSNCLFRVGGFFFPRKKYSFKKGRKDPVVRKEGKPEFTRKRVSLYTPLATRGPWRLSIWRTAPFIFLKYFFFFWNTRSPISTSSSSSFHRKNETLTRVDGPCAPSIWMDSLTCDPSVISVRPLLGSKLGQKRAGRSDNVHTLIRHHSACAPSE